MSDTKEQQLRLDTLVDEYLDVNIRRGELALLVWLLSYAAAARTPGIDVRTGKVLSMLLAAGYRAEDHTLHPATNKPTYGRRMIGTFIESVARGELPSRETMQEWLRTVERLPNA